jgi:O-antigen/teichoic acid export membrane protein
VKPGAVAETRAPAAARGVAVRNMAIVAGSLLATWSVALLVRLVLPRSLGPALFGRYSFAEALAIDGFAFLGLGIDIYVQKEIPRRPRHASDFFGGVQAARLLASAVVFPLIALLAWRAGYSTTVVGTALALGVAQLCILLANTCATLLYAARRVGRLSVLNIASKLVWAAGIGLALAYHARLWVFALAAVVSEALRLTVLYRLARDVAGVRAHLRVKETLAALKRSSPYWINQVAVVLYAKIDVAIMGLLVTDREIGYYGAATNVSSVAMLMAPFMDWVLMPELSRTVRDRAEFSAMVRRALEWTVVLAVPIATMLGLSADTVVHTVFGDRFEPAVAAMRTLAPQFAFVYVAMLGAASLILLDRSWTVTLVTVCSLVVNATLNLAVLRPALHLLGDGGAGVGAAAVSVGTEAAVATTYVWLLRREVLDARNLTAAAKSLGACALVVSFHAVCPRLGGFRLVLDAALYAALAVASRTVRVGELVALVRSTSSKRGGHAIP